MVVSDLYNEILIKPYKKGCDELLIVSGFASATFAYKHLVALDEIRKGVKIGLLIGMKTGQNDIGQYKNLVDIFNGFNVSFYASSPPIHSKLYLWLKNGVPVDAYSGSANYSQYGFFENSQINQITNDNPYQIYDFYREKLNFSTPVKEIKEQDKITLASLNDSSSGSITPGKIEWLIPNKAVKISLLAKGGSLPQRSGLNWGQRPELKREPNQAYLPIRGNAREEGFLPEIGFTFTLKTDDGQYLDCCVAQQGRKAIHSTYDNSLIGKYFRSRLGLDLGELVSNSHLEKYGRSDFTIVKIDDENFYLDFSV